MRKREQTGEALRLRHRRRRHRGLTMLGLSLLLLVVGAGRALAATGEYQTNDYQGTQADIIGSYFTPNAGNCTLFAIVGSVNGHQMESGDVRCAANTALDGSCGANGKYSVFIESYQGGGNTYACYNEGTYTPGTNTTFNEHIGSGTTWTAYINGSAKASLVGIGPHALIHAWGEETPTMSCSGWHALGKFGYWKGMRSGKYSTLTSGVHVGPCWSLTAINSFGDFDVSH